MENESLQQLESQLEEIEKESEASEIEWQFQETLKSYRGEDEVISFQKYRELNKNIKRQGFSSGLGRLDEIIEGFHKGDLVTITGETGQGKTSFSQFLTTEFSKQGMRSLWFSYEMPISNFLDKFGELLPEGYLPKVLNDRNITWIERKVVEAIVKYKVQCVFIDHLHYLFDMRGSKNVSLEIGEIMRQLKVIAKKYNITIFIMAHTGKSKDDGTVGLDNIRDSSFVAQESDYVIAVWRVRDPNQTNKDKQVDGTRYTKETKVFVAKNRYLGKIGSIGLEYEFKGNVYKDLIPSQKEVKKSLEEIDTGELFNG